MRKLVDVRVYWPFSYMRVQRRLQSPAGAGARQVRRHIPRDRLGLCRQPFLRIPNTSDQLRPWSDRLAADDGADRTGFVPEIADERLGLLLVALGDMNQHR